MIGSITYRKAIIDDLNTIINLILQDDLGQLRESKELELDRRYIDAFHNINSDPNQYLMVVENDVENGRDIDREIVGTCHLTIMPSLTFIGSTRLQIEAVRVCRKYRGQKIGQWMMNVAINYGKSKGASIIQLTTNKQRSSAKNFYERLGFEATHEGMKLYLEKNYE